MSEDAATYRINSRSADGKTSDDHDSWAIKLYRRQRYLTIEALDYHAGPLTISRDDLVNIARNMGLHVRTRKKKKNAAVK